MEETLQALDDLISQFLNLDRSLWFSSDDADAFLEAVDELTSTIHGLENTSADHVLLESFDLLLERCSTRLKDEFQQLVGTSGFSGDHGDHNSKRSQNEDDNHTFVAQPVINFDIIVDALPEGVVTEANRIARRMIAAGFGDTCAETYASARRNFIDESIARLGVNAHLEESCKSMVWEELETQIMHWIPAIRVVFHILIPSERHLCNCIFKEFTSYANLAFATACKPFLQLLSFAKVIAAAGHSPESLFRIVDMYDALTDILPVLDEAFDHEVAALRECLGLSIKGIFVALENLIRCDPCESSPPDGGLHPITRAEDYAAYCCWNVGVVDGMQSLCWLLCRVQNLAQSEHAKQFLDKVYTPYTQQCMDAVLDWRASLLIGVCRESASRDKLQAHGMLERRGLNGIVQLPPFHFPHGHMARTTGQAELNSELQGCV